MKKDHLSNKFTQTFLVLIFIFIFSFNTLEAKASIFDNIINLFTKDDSDNSDINTGDSYLLKPAISNIDSTSSDDNTDDDINIKEDGTIVVQTGPMRISTEKEKQINDTISVYEIKDGDTLDSVAKLFGVSKNTILWANDIKNKKLIPGQTLLIFPMTGLQFTAKKDVTLSDIAKKYNVDIDDIATYNGISKDAKIVKGDSVFIPDAEGEIVPENTKANKKDSIGKIKQTTKKATPKYKTNAIAGYFMRPVAGCVKTQGLHGSYSTAVDWGCPIGTTVASAAAGTVIRASESGYNGGYGEVVIISHPNGTQSIYAHLSRIDVVNGQKVSQGQVLGATGNTGRSTGPHLHFETRGTSNPF